MRKVNIVAVLLKVSALALCAFAIFVDINVSLGYEFSPEVYHLTAPVSVAIARAFLLYAFGEAIQLLQNISSGASPLLGEKSPQPKVAAECHFHKGRDAAGAYAVCGRQICGDCSVSIDGHLYCKTCVVQVYEKKQGSE